MPANSYARGLAALYASTFLSGAWAMILPTISLLLLYWTLGFNPANNPQEFF